MNQKLSRSQAMIWGFSWAVTFAAWGCSASGGPHPAKYTAPNVDVLTEASAAATLNIADPYPNADPKKAREQNPEDTDRPSVDVDPPQNQGNSRQAPEVLHFPWRPPHAPAGPYRLEEPEDRHTLVIFPEATHSDPVTVLVGFHGQPQRGKPPREYKFAPTVIDTVSRALVSEDLPPLVLALPVFRFQGRNWPGFDPKAFRTEVERLLSERKITPSRWLAFGHSGASGCGGNGLNDAHRMRPDAVGFFDTCLGRGWSKQLQDLRRLEIPSVSIHSVETAGFRPKQVPEYQHLFDFGRAYGPAGLAPVQCPSKTPGPKLRDQEYRCAATEDGLAEGYIVDSGEGQEAHEAMLTVALRYFLERYGRP